MKAHRIIAAGVVALALSSYSATAFASTGDEAGQSSASDTSTTVPAKRDAAAVAQYRADLRAWRSAMAAWLSERAAVAREFRQSIAAASAILNDALGDATTKEARQAAMTEFKSARTAAATQRDSAIRALGERPVRPTR